SAYRPPWPIADDRCHCLKCAKPPLRCGNLKIRQLESFERLATNDESSSPTKYREGARREFVRGIAQRRRSMPSALMRELRGVGLMPRRRAAAPGNLPVGGLKRGDDILPLQLREFSGGADARGGAVASRCRRRASRAVGQRAIEIEAPGARGDHGALEHVLQLAHVAGP